MQFSESIPADWAEYVTVEIGGADPNGLDLFGLDNTPIKDSGNKRLDELLGGRNAESAAAGNLPFGGIFVESFLTLSLSHPTPAIIADERFDVVFGPLQGGQATQAQIEQGVHVLANLVGSTITHEIGHVLGLAAIQGDVHNPADVSGGLMDRGSDRPFAERAALAGWEPARFTGANAAYLQALLGE